LVHIELIADEHGEVPMERRAAIRQAARDWGLAGINHSKENGVLLAIGWPLDNLITIKPPSAFDQADCDRFLGGLDVVLKGSISSS
jgi:hypothetical protein